MEHGVVNGVPAHILLLLPSLFASSTRVRIQAIRIFQQAFTDSCKVAGFLKHILTKFCAALDPDEFHSILWSLLSTHSRYHDRPSRRAVQKCLRAALENTLYANGSTATIATYLRRESQKSATAPTNAFVLLELCVLVQEEIAEGNDIFRTYIADVAAAAALSQHKCLEPGVRSSLQHAAVVLSKRGLGVMMQADDLGDDVLKILLTKLVLETPAAKEYTPYIGVLAGVCSRLPSKKALFAAYTKDILSFFVQTVVGSKIAVDSHIANGLHDFFSSFVSPEDLPNDLAPSIEKAILRSPEIVIPGVLPALVQSLRSTIDLADLLATNLLQPLLSSLHSTNDIIRNGASRTLEGALGGCHDTIRLCKITESLLTALRTAKPAMVEYRCLLARVIMAVPPSPEVSSIIVHGIVMIATKETNERVFEAEIGSFSRHLMCLLVTNARIEQSVFDLALKGSVDQRPMFRKVWLLKLGATLWDMQDRAVNLQARAFAESLIAKLHNAFTEMAPNPLPAAQSGIISISFVMTALSRPNLSKAFLIPPLTRESIIRQSLVVAPKPSFLLNNKTYSRLGTSEDLLWAIRALSGVTDALLDTTTDVKVAWAQAMLYLITSSEISPEVRREAGKALSKAYLKDPEAVGQSIVFGVWDWLQSLALMDKDSVSVASKPGKSRLHLALKHISPSRTMWHEQGKVYPESIIKSQLVSCLVLCRPELVPRTDWISICLKSGIDPGVLARERQTELMHEVFHRFETGKASSTETFKMAACNAAAELAFVAPGTMMSLLIHQIRGDLDPAQLKDLGPIEAAIARLPADIAFVDVLNPKVSNVHENKNVKDYDVLKWEQELRAQLAQKKGQQKKLTLDEQAKMAAQLAREVAIRQKVSEVSAKLRRGAGIVRSLAQGPPTDAGVWMTDASVALLDALDAGAEHFVNAEIVCAYLACSDQVTVRLGALRKSIGIATLRAAGHFHLPQGSEDEKLGDLVTRVLYRLRFAAEVRPFESASLAYMLPLIFIVIDRGSVGCDSDEDADAQILLALEFLTAHVDSCANVQLPRAHILQRLVISMQRYAQHYRLLKDAIVQFCRCISSSIQPEELKVLLDGTTSPDTSVRAALLQAVRAEIDLTDLDYSKEIWLACHDGDEENVELASAIWDENGLVPEEALVFDMLEYVRSQDRATRTAAARALTHALAANPLAFEELLSTLQETYRRDVQPRVPQRDKHGMTRKSDFVDHWEARSGIALAFRALTPVFTSCALVLFLDFLANAGPLVDKNATVRSEMVAAGTHLVAEKGRESLEPLMKLFETILDTPNTAAEESDLVNEAVIVLYGSLSRHLGTGDSRVQWVISKLLGALSTPSESVQYAVAGCLPPLVRLVDEEVKVYVEQLTRQLFEGKNYASRRGAAYGLAGIISGKGLSALRQFRIMNTLRSAAENKKSAEHRQGALFAYELFSLHLGRTFEPYIIEILPQLLACFGDPSASVREACLDTAKTYFATLSSFGLRQVLPRLLDGLDDPQWRSKKGACDLLGAMAYLDPQQLANSLPDIIPPLTAVLSDSHKEVRAAANRSLQRFGEVISNPEVKGLVNVLLRALSDPTKYTEEALDGLIKVSFVHYLDSPSLALVVRILERGLADRSSTKRKAAQIIGSLAHLTERRDLVSHLPILVSGLRVAAIDPVPATRATASKALGSLVEKLGEDALPDLIPSLMTSLRTDTGAGDRLGSAQALSEVLAGLGTTRLEDMLPTILQNVSSTKASVREGFMTLFIFLPVCFGNTFAAYLSRIIPSILGGLADDLEAIRDTSLRAGRLLVKNFATKAIDLLLPELQRGLADDSYRIRLSSVELVGDLLFNLTGISSKTDTDDEDEDAAQAGQSLLEVLGEERRNRVLSSLYICRCDTSGLVRSAAINVWKALVATPRTLRELVPTLTQMIISRLGSSNMEHKIIAGNALGEVIRKAGEGVLATLLPSLEEALQSSTDPDERQGICIALREVVTAGSPEAVEDYEKKLIAIVRIALVDSDADVREAAAESFDSLQQVFGKRAVDQVLPYLLNLLGNDSEAENALSALLTLLTDTSRANVILPNLIPTLLTSPISSFNAKAIASLAKVGGPTMTRRLPAIINTLADNIVSASHPELKAELILGLEAVISSVDEFDGLNAAMGVMLLLIKHDDHRKRALAASQLATFFATPSVDYSRYNQDLIRVLLISFDDRDIAVVEAAWEALSQLTGHLRKEEMETLVVSTRQTLQQVGVSGSNLPGFCLPKGILPVLHIFLHGLMNGTSEQRMQSALAISDIIDRSSANSLKPFVTQITGPLIRVVSERSVDVKSAILFTLNRLLEKIPTFLRPFLPQLQRTFTKSMADPSSDILRSRATKALSTLITLTPRVDPLIAELVTGSKSQDTGVRNTMLKGLHEVVSKVGANMSDTSKETILSLIDSNHDAENAVTSSRLLGALINVLPPASAMSMIKNRVICQPSTQASVLALNAVLLESAASLTRDFSIEARNVLCNGMTNKSVSAYP